MNALTNFIDGPSAGGIVSPSERMSEPTVLAHSCAAAVLEAPPSGKWYCVEAERFREAEARDRIEDQGFGAFLPLVIEMRTVRPGVMQARSVPAFPGYLFTRFDIKHDRWRSIVYTRGVRGLFCHAPDTPTPVPQRQIDVLLALGYDRPIAKDPRPALIEVGARVRVTGGAFTDHEGVCLWDDRKRVGLLFEMFGGQRVIPIPKAWAKPA